MSNTSKKPTISGPKISEDPKNTSKTTPDTDFDERFKQVLIGMGVKESDPQYKTLMALDKEKKQLMISTSSKTLSKVQSVSSMPTKPQTLNLGQKPIEKPTDSQPVERKDSFGKKDEINDGNIDIRFQELLDSMGIKQTDIRYKQLIALDKKSKIEMIKNSKLVS